MKCRCQLHCLSSPYPRLCGAMTALTRLVPHTQPTSGVTFAAADTRPPALGRDKCWPKATKHAKMNMNVDRREAPSFSKAVVSQPKPYLHPAKTIFRRSCTVDPPHNISPLFAKVGHPFSADKILRFKEFATGARDREQELLIVSSQSREET